MRHRVKSAWLAGATLIAGLATIPASATQTDPLSNVAPVTIAYWADAIVQVKVTSVSAPEPEAYPNPLSVADVEIVAVFKGAVAPEERLTVGFLRDAQNPGAGLYVPGRRRMLALWRIGPQGARGFTLPQGTPLPEWTGPAVGIPLAVAGRSSVFFNRAREYDKTIQGKEFRAIATAWRDPMAHLDHRHTRLGAAMVLLGRGHAPARAFRVVFEEGSEWNKLTALDMVCATANAPAVPRWVAVSDPRDALEPLAELLERLARQSATARPTPERRDDPRLVWLFRRAQRALRCIPIDSWRHGGVLARLAVVGAMDDPLRLRVLDAGAARWEVRDALLERLATHVRYDWLDILQWLDARAAYPFLAKLEESLDRAPSTAEMLARYQTAWSIRARVERGDDDVWLHHSGPAWFAGLAQSSGPPTGANALALADHLEANGPDFGGLAGLVEATGRWTAHQPATGKFFDLTAPQREALSAWLVQTADPSATGLNADAQAEWIVDLFPRPPSGHGKPAGQLWISKDGTFGFSWLPDRAWGRSVSAVQLLHSEDR